MEFGNQYYYEITVKQRDRELVREAESYRLLKQANLLQEKRIARLMLKFNQVDVPGGLNYVKQLVSQCRIPLVSVWLRKMGWANGCFPRHFSRRRL
jgi:hypothetical protein